MRKRLRQGRMLAGSGRRCSPTPALHPHPHPHPKPLTRPVPPLPTSRAPQIKGPGMPMTRDYRMDRVVLFVDDDGKVSRVPRNG